MTLGYFLQHCISYIAAIIMTLDTNLASYIIDSPVFHDMGLMLCNKLIISNYIVNKTCVILHV